MYPTFTSVSLWHVAAKTTSHLPRQLTYCRQRIYPSQWETYALAAEWYTSRSCHVYEVKAALALHGQTQPKVCPHDTKAVLLKGDSLMKVRLLTARSSSICQTTHSSHCYLQTTGEAVCLSAWGTVHLHIPSSNILHLLHPTLQAGFNMYRESENFRYIKISLEKFS